MNQYQKNKRFFWILFWAIVVGVIALGIATGNKDASHKDSIYEKVFKLSTFFIVMLGLLLFWLLPKTKLAKHFKMSETLFITTCVIGVICGILGLIVTFIWQELVVETHLFEFILIPFILIYIYWAIIMDVKRTSELTDLLDEKQITNMTSAAATTLALSSGIMLIMYFMSSNAVFELEGKIWFLFYFFMTLLIYSANTLFYFRRA